MRNYNIPAMEWPKIYLSKLSPNGLNILSACACDSTLYRLLLLRKELIDPILMLSNESNLL